LGTSINVDSMLMTSLKGLLPGKDPKEIQFGTPTNP